MSKDFTDNELKILSDCVLYALNQSYESIKTLQTLGMDATNVVKQTEDYRELNSKLCNMMSE